MHIFRGMGTGIVFEKSDRLPTHYWRYVDDKYEKETLV
jgi:hypothetical protein